MARPTADQLAEDLRHLVGALVRRVRAETADDEALPYPLRSLLRRLELDGPATTADLARGEQITPQAAGAFVAKLEADGYVSRRDDAHDGRRRLVSVTAAGRKAIAVGRAHRRSWLAKRIGERLGADEQRTLVEALPVLRKLVEG
jgi:DNA-binding MarR family transcriptional regulator